MIYSVYDYQTGRYCYYDAPAKLPAAGWFREPLGNLPIPEAIAEQLPKGAKYVGHGSKAKGVIATTSSSENTELSVVYSLPSWVKALTLVGFGFFLGRRFKK